MASENDIFWYLIEEPPVVEPPDVDGATIGHLPKVVNITIPEDDITEHTVYLEMNRQGDVFRVNFVEPPSEG